MPETRSPANIDAVSPFPGYPVGSVVGGDTALVTSDGDASYVEVSHDGIFVHAPTAHTFTFETAGPVPAGAVVTVEADWFTDNAGAFVLYVVHPVFGSTSIASFVTPGDVDTHAYGDVETRTILPVFTEGGAIFEAGVEWGVYALQNHLFVPTSARITRLTLLIESGEPPLRQRNRDTIRARNLGSRQRGIRQRGYL